jgi:hypothetical protein
MVGATGSNQTAKARSTSTAFVFNASTNTLSVANLGVGEQSPGSKLVVRADSAGGRGGEISIVNYATSTVGNEAALNFGLESSTYNADFGNAQIKARTNNLNAAADLIFSTWNGSSFGERVRLLSDGKFGINTNAPLQTLDVRGNFLLAADSTTSTHITQKPYTINNGTLSWEGSAGQLFSITNNLTSGSIFSVNDVSGIPSIDVDANGTVELAPFGGNVGVGTINPTSKFHVVGNTLVDGSISAIEFTATSDIRLKTNIQPIQSSLTKLLELSGVTFDWKESKKSSVGVIAQDVEKVLPELVQEVGNNKTVNYNGLVALLIEVLKEQQEQINNIKNELNSRI